MCASGVPALPGSAAPWGRPRLRREPSARLTVARLTVRAVERRVMAGTDVIVT